MRHQSFGSFFTQYFKLLQYTCYLNKICLVIDGANFVDLCFINMPMRKMIQQVAKTEYLQFLTKQIAPQRTNAFQVFDGSR
jgi:hypothetical protein